MSSLEDYLDKCDEDIEEFDREFAEDEVKLDEYINDAYAALDNAFIELYLKKNIMSQTYTVTEFEQHMMSELASMFNKKMKVRIEE